MNKKLFPALVGLTITHALSAQFAQEDVKYWIGSGTDSTALVVDFNDGSFDSSYAWGYIYSGTATGADMLNAIAADDVNFSVNISGGFLNDIIYNDHQGIGGSPNGWATWDGMDPTTLSSNGGIGDTLISGGWFGCSYTDFNPATEPGEPIAALDPDFFTLEDLSFFVGSGNDTAMLVIDFPDLNQPSSFAWGYLFNDSTTGEDMLNDIAAADPLLSIKISGGFLNDIYYQSLAGEAGNPDYWGTWSATNYGNWGMNTGIGTSIKPGDLFGCTYFNFDAPYRPDYPAAAINTIGLPEPGKSPAVQVFPQPAKNQVHLQFNGDFTEKLQLLAPDGKLIREIEITEPQTTINVSTLPSGLYLLHSGQFTQKLLVQ